MKSGYQSHAKADYPLSPAPATQDDPAVASNSPHRSDVYIVGAGPAGLSAAYVLARAGLRVTIVDGADQIGGKVWSRHADGRSREHGVHGWWINYINFDRMLKWAGIAPGVALVRAKGGNLMLPDGQDYRIRQPRRTLPSPLFLIAQFLRSPFLSFRDVLSVARLGIHLLSFDHERDYAKYDDFSFQQLLDHCRVSRRSQQRVFAPFILSFDFTVPGRVSAACGLSGLQFYVIHDQQSIVARWARLLPADAIFNPLQAGLAKLGVAIQLGRSCDSVEVTNAEVTGIHLTDSDPLPSTLGSPPWVILVAIDTQQVPATGFKLVTGQGGLPIFVGRGESGFVAFSGRCTHAGCTVGWQDDARCFLCPCHGGRFAPTGVVLSGPPDDALRALQCQVTNGIVQVVGQPPPTLVPARDVIIATDVGQAQQLIARTSGVDPELKASLNRLDTTPVIVVRMWFKQDVRLHPDIDTAVTPEFTYIDNFFHVDSFDEDIVAEGQVIEVQCYRPGDLLSASDDHVLDAVLGDLRLIHSSYSRANLISPDIKHSVDVRRMPGRLRVMGPVRRATDRGTTPAFWVSSSPATGPI